MSSRLTILVTLATALMLGVVPQALAQRFHPNDPLLADDDRLIDVTEEPAEIELSDMYDRFTHIFHISGEPPFPAFVEAQNVNTLDEVPDSSWFTNRHGPRPFSISELATASNVDGLPTRTRPGRSSPARARASRPALRSSTAGATATSSSSTRWAFQSSAPQPRRSARRSSGRSAITCHRTTWSGSTPTTSPSRTGRWWRTPGATACH